MCTAASFVSAERFLLLGRSLTCICGIVSFTMACFGMGLSSNVLTTSYMLVVGRCGLNRILASGWSLAVLVYSLGIFAVSTFAEKKDDIEQDMEVGTWRHTMLAGLSIICAQIVQAVFVPSLNAWTSTDTLPSLSRIVHVCYCWI